MKDLSLEKLLDDEFFKDNMLGFMKRLHHEDFYLLFNNDHLIELTTEDNLCYIPIFTSKEQFEGTTYTRVDKVKLDVVIRDILKLDKYHAISLNPYTHDFIMNRKFISIYTKLNEGDENMDNQRRPYHLQLVAGTAGSGKTKRIVDTSNEFQESNKILIVSLEHSKDILVEKYGLVVSNNVVVIDTPTAVEDIRDIIENVNPKYLLIDYMQMLRINNDDVDHKKQELILEQLKHYIEEFDIITLIADDISNDESVEKYSTDEYNLCDQIWLLNDGVISRIK